VPNLIILATLGAGAYFAYRWIKKQIREAAIEAARDAQKSQQSDGGWGTPKAERARDAGELVWDEKAGVYRKKD